MGAVLALTLLVAAGLTLGPDLFGSGSSRGSELVPAEPNPDTPVVLVILDELPNASLMKSNQKIDAHRYPNFAKLVAGSTWYRDNAAAGDFTAWAVPPILTGNHSNERTLPTNEVQPDNIFNLLGPGRRVHAMEEVTELCSKRFCPDGHQGEYPDIPEADEFIKAKFKRLDIPAINDWIDTIPAGERTLSIIHLPLPHQPLLYLPKGQRYPGGPLGFTIDAERNDWTISDAGVSLVQQRHLLQAGYADLMVGKIMKKIKANGDFDDSLVVVTADHGVSYDVRYDRRDAEPQSLAATLNPPLIIKYPHQRQGRISKASTQNIDITPTIAEMLGVTDRYPTEGVPVDQVPEGRQMIADKDLGARIGVTADQIRAQRPALLRVKDKRFGTGGLWKLGPKFRLIGKRPGRVATVRRAKVTVDSARQLARYRPRAGYVPSFLTGVLSGIKPNQVVAVALNGRITGTTRTFRYKGRMRFGTMAIPSAFRRGANRIAVYKVSRTGKLKRIRESR